MDGLSRNQATPCFDAFVSALKLDGLANQIYDTLVFTLINDVPSPGGFSQRLLQNQSVEVQEGIETSMRFWQGERNDVTKEIILDYRVLIWVNKDVDHLVETLYLQGVIGFDQSLRSV